jgi:hypothetical protein
MLENFVRTLTVPELATMWKQACDCNDQPLKELLSAEMKRRMPQAEKEASGDE